MACSPSTSTTPISRATPKLQRNEARAYFDMEMEPAEVLAAIGRENYSIRWTGALTPSATGEYQLIVRTARWNRTGKVRMFLDEQELDFSGGPATQMTSTQAVPAHSPTDAREGAAGGRAHVPRARRVQAARDERDDPAQLGSADRRRTGRGRKPS